MPSAGAPIGGDAGAAGSKPGAAGAPYGACASLQHHGPPVSKLAGDTGATPSPPLFVFGAGGAANIGNGGSSGAVPPGFTPAAWPGAGTTAGSSSTAPVVVFQGRSPAGATAEACTSVVVNQVACTSVVVSSDPGYIPVPRGGPRKMQRPEGSSFQEETASGTQHSTVAVAASKGGSLTAGDGAGDEDSKGEEEEEEDEEGCWEPEGKKVKGAIRECESDEGEADKGEGQEQEKQKEQKEEAGCTAVALVAAGPEAAEPNDTAGDDDPRLSPPKRVSGAGTDPQDAYSFALGSLPDAVLCHVFDKLPPNETPVCRLACKGVAACLTQKRYRTLHLREPLPGYAQEIADCLLVLADPELEGLSYVKQVQLLYTAAASGSVLNMAAADALMDRIMPPDMRASGDWRDELHRGELDPATSAAKAGHLNCVMWCIRNKGLVWSTDELMLAVAQHCKLEDWGQLGEVLVRDRFGRMEYYRGSLPLELKHHGAALDSPWGDARGKVQRLVEHGWVEGSGMGSGSSAWRVIEMVQAGEPMAEVRKAFLEVVGGDLDAEKLVYLVARTLQSGRLDVAEWLWTKLHVRLHPGMAGGAKDSAYNVVLDRLARAGAVVGLRWLRGRGLELEGPGLPRPLLAAAEAGQLAAVRFFVEECGHRADEGGWRVQWGVGHCAATRRTHVGAGHSGALQAATAGGRAAYRHGIVGLAGSGGYYAAGSTLCQTDCLWCLGAGCCNTAFWTVLAAHNFLALDTHDATTQVTCQAHTARTPFGFVTQTDLPAPSPCCYRPTPQPSSPPPPAPVASPPPPGCCPTAAPPPPQPTTPPPRPATCPCCTSCCTPPRAPGTAPHLPPSSACGRAVHTATRAGCWRP